MVVVLGDYYQALHKKKYGESLSRELFQYHHKRNYAKDIYQDMLPIAWHPD